MKVLPRCNNKCQCQNSGYCTGNPCSKKVRTRKIHEEAVNKKLCAAVFEIYTSLEAFAKDMNVSIRTAERWIYAGRPPLEKNRLAVEAALCKENLFGI